MRLKYLALGLAVVIGGAGARSPPRRQRTESYVPLFTYRTGPVCRVRDTDRQRHVGLFHHAQRA